VEGSIRKTQWTRQGSSLLLVIVSPAQRQSSETLRGLKLLCSQIPNAPRMVVDTVLKVEFENGSRILGASGQRADDQRHQQGRASDYRRGCPRA
jgi:hypothetical protein